MIFPVCVVTQGLCPGSFLDDKRSLTSRLRFRQAGHFLFVESTSLGLVLQWDGANRLDVRAQPSWRGRLQGLCGDADGRKENDFT